MEETARSRANKNYKLKHREELKVYNKQYYAQNKETMLGQLKETVTCECGCQLNKGHLVRHQKSPKHLKLML